MSRNFQYLELEGILHSSRVLNYLQTLLYKLLQHQVHPTLFDRNYYIISLDAVTFLIS